MDFLNFFGLKEDPFKLTPDPAYYYPSASHNEGLLLMDYAIDQKEGFLLVIGDPGSGKTTLLRVFLEKWKDEAEIAIVLTPRLSPEEFLISVAEDLHISLANKNKNEIIRELRDFMTAKSIEGKRVIMIVDEAQNLPDETLEELRLLSNLETDKDKLLQIILLGQPELETKLTGNSLRQLNQRISTRVHLKHFSPEETLDYINYRVIKAGKKNLQIHKKVSRLIFKLSNGIPRLINMIISRALMAAFLEESNIIHPRHIEHAVSSLKHSDIKIQRNIMVPVFAGLTAFLVAAFLIYFISRPPETQLTLKSSETPAMNRTFQVNPTKLEKNLSADTRLNATPVLAFKLLNVNVDVAIVRYKPSMDSGKAGWTLKGNQLVVLNETVDENQVKWFQILFQGEKRWISEAVVNIAGMEDEIKPVINISEENISNTVEEIPAPLPTPEEKSFPNDSKKEVSISSRQLSSIE
jgi:general secretion pathway protein A